MKRFEDIPLFHSVKCVNICTLNLFCVVCDYIFTLSRLSIITMSKESIGHSLREQRKKHNYSQAVVGKLLSCDRAIISKMENGKYQGSLLLLERYISLMGFELTVTPINRSNRPTLDNLENLYD